MRIGIHKLHKYAGVFSGIFLLLLALSGFFLNHDNWKFLYSTTFSNRYIPNETIQQNQRLYNAFHIDTTSKNIYTIAGFRGVYVSRDFGKNYLHSFDIPVYSMIEIDDGNYYVATSEGLYYSSDKANTWKRFALDGKIVTSLSYDDDKFLVVVDKSELILLNKKGSILSHTTVNIEQSELEHDISLSRLIRDVHYGRGLFDNGISLLLNDFSALWLTLLALSGYVLWYLIKSIRHHKSYKKPLNMLLKIHASSWVLIAVVPLIFLVITGIFLDHGQFFANFMRKTKISHSVLPPIYNSLKEDIWAIDMYDGTYRIGNRYGVYKSNDMNKWKFESKGFAYKFIRKQKKLYVSGMGSANRIYMEHQWSILENTPHMFKSVNPIDDNVQYFSTHDLHISLPKVNTTTLYTILYSIHDGSFFASWWVYINDIASLFLLLLLYTGLRLWYKRVRRNI